MARKWWKIEDPSLNGTHHCLHFCFHSGVLTRWMIIHDLGWKLGIKNAKDRLGDWNRNDLRGSRFVFNFCPCPKHPKSMGPNGQHKKHHTRSFPPMLDPGNSRKIWRNLQIVAFWSLGWISPKWQFTIVKGKMIINHTILKWLITLRIPHRMFK